MTKYYVGDLCYVINKTWYEVCSLHDKNREPNTYTLSNSVTIGIADTQNGDGVYSDNFDNEYPVDSGTIGFIRVSDIEADKLVDITLGQVYEFEDIPTIQYFEGLITIGFICINTSTEDSETN